MEASSGRALLQLFADENPREVVQSTIEGAEEALHRRASDSDLAAELDAIGLEYSPGAEGMTHRQWLEQVVEVLGESLHDG
jgi:hypothetical protein